jgi:hypothetical protein
MRHVANSDLWDIRHVAANLSVQNDAERLALGLSKPELIKLLHGLATAGHSETAMNEGMPVAAYGVKESPDGLFNDTWFVATSTFFEMGVSGFRYGRTRVAYFRERFGLPLRALSWSPVAEAPKWFKSFGFVESGRVDGCRAFVYR